MKDRSPQPGITMTRILSCLLAFALPLAHATEEPQQLTPYQWQQQQKVAFEKSEKVYNEALKRDGLLAEYQALRDAYRADKNEAFRIVFGQYLSWYQTFIGDYPAAHDSYWIRQLPAPDDNTSPLTGGYTSKSALDEVAELAQGRKAVFLNEAHNVPITRTLTVQLLPKLRAEGFTYFAVETLYESDKDLQQRGYPVNKSGFYVQEPIYGDMVRTALKLGFKIVAYESEKEVAGDVREHEQAENIYERVFKKDPNARLVVNAGYAHIQETGRFLGGQSMAQHFKRISGIDPLTVEQTMMIKHPHDNDDHPFYKAAMEQLHPATPIVFVDGKGTPWSLKAKAYDVSVFIPQQQLSNGRPTWLELGGLRKSYVVGKELCEGHFPCLIEARYADESDDAIPEDRLVLDNIDLLTTMSSSTLYLRPGNYRLTATDAANRVASRHNISVGGAQ